MRICKQVKFIKGGSLDELQTKLNEALLEGAELKAIDIASLTGAVIVTEYMGEIQKTELDLLEEEFGCHHCEECPFYEEPTDRRKKWSECGKGRRVQKLSCCCTAYYELLREEVKSEISEDQRDDERVRLEGGRCSGMAEGITASRVRQTKRTVKIPSFGNAVSVGAFEDTARRTIQGGERRC